MRAGTACQCIASITAIHMDALAAKVGELEKPQLVQAFLAAARDLPTDRVEGILDAVQRPTQRRDSQKGLLRLPTDVLFKIASQVVSPDLVVAAGRNLEARTALRRGTDAAERSRFGGVGITVREAEHVLRTRYRDWLGDVDLDSRESVRRAFLPRKNYVFSSLTADHPDITDEAKFIRLPPNNPTSIIGWVAARCVRTLMAYGADPTLRDEFGCTPLHHVTAHIAPGALDLAKLLLAAGVDIDAECCPIDLSGTSALSWSVALHNRMRSFDPRCEMATFLIEQGCDVVKAHAGFAVSAHYNESSAARLTLLGAIEDRPRTPARERLMDLIREALEEAGPERREAAFREAQRRLDDWIESMSDSDSNSD